MHWQATDAHTKRMLPQGVVHQQAGWHAKHTYTQWRTSPVLTSAWIVGLVCELVYSSLLANSWPHRPTESMKRFCFSTG